MPENLSSHWDLIIIGGGLAGLSSAILSSRQGLKVLVIEKDSYPRHKVCGEFISMESYGFLLKLGLPIPDLHLPYINQFTLTSYLGPTASCTLKKGGFGISRYLLDHLLMQIAQENGVLVLQQHKVIELHYNADLKQYVLTTHKQMIFNATLVIGAFGRMNPLLPQPKPRSITSFVGIKYHIESDLKPDTIEIHSFKNGYCGISRIEDLKYCICYLARSEDLKKYHGDISMLESQVLMQNRFLKKRLNHRILEGPIVTSQFHFSIQELTYNQVLLSGDAAGFIPPLTGNGMSLAFRSAHQLQPLIRDFFDGSINLEKIIIKQNKYISTYLSSRIQKGIFLQKLLFVENPILSNALMYGLTIVPGLMNILANQAIGDDIV